MEGCIDLGNDVVNVSYSPPADITPFDHLEYIEQKNYIHMNEKYYGNDFKNFQLHWQRQLILRQALIIKMVRSLGA